MPIVTSAPAPATTRSILPEKIAAPSLEAAPPTEVAAVEGEKKLSPQYAALARRELALRKRDEAIKAREIQWEQQRKAKDEEYASKYIPKDKLAKDPLATIFESGITKDQLIDMLLNGAPQVDPKIQTLEERQSAIESKIEAQSKAQAEAQTKAYEQAVNEIRKQAETLVGSNLDYETIKETGSTEAVVELIKQTYEAEGVLLSVEDAAKQVEDHLLNEALKMAGLTKVKAKLAPTMQDEKIDPNKKISLAEAKAQAPQQTQIKTLTNAATATPSKPLSAMSRRERAILAYKGQLPT